MAGTKLSAEEQQFFDNPPDDAPLEEATGDRTPHEELPEEGGTGGEEKPEAEAKKPEAKAKEGDDKSKKEPEKAKDTKKPEEKQKTVPHGAMEAERQRRKQVEAAFETFKREQAERQARLDERLSIINEALKPKEEEPDPDKDIFGAFEHLRGQFQELQQRHQTEQQQTAEQRRQQEQVNQIRVHYMADAEAFSAETPDFKDAYQFLLTSRQKELRLLPAYRSNPLALRQAIEQDELAIVQSALDNGESPAAVMYAIAQARGYAPKIDEEPPVEEEVKPEEKPAPTGNDKIEEIEKRRDASISLSDGGGSPGGEKITLEAIDRMKPDEFKAFVAKINKNNPKGMDKLMQRLMLGG